MNFETEDAEREFWAEHDSTEYIDWSEASSAIFPNLKPTTQFISLRPLPPLPMSHYDVQKDEGYG